MTGFDLTPLPAWVTLGEQPCVTASCTDCGVGFGDEDTSTLWHFDTLPELLKAIAEASEGYEGYEDDAPWRIDGDALLCDRCAAKRQCAVHGHQWRQHDAFVPALDLGPSHPEYWRCDRSCGAMTRVDPAAACRVCGCTFDHACEGGCSWRPDDGHGPCCTACDPTLTAAAGGAS